MTETLTIDSIPRAEDRAPGTRVELVRPKRSRLMRLLADTDLDWRAQACTKLLVNGWTEIRVETSDEGDRVSAVSPPSKGDPR